MPSTASLDNVIIPMASISTSVLGPPDWFPVQISLKVPPQTSRAPAISPRMVPEAPQTEHGENRAEHCPLLLFLSLHPISVKMPLPGHLCQPKCPRPPWHPLPHAPHCCPNLGHHLSSVPCNLSPSGNTDLTICHSKTFQSWCVAGGQVK